MSELQKRLVEIQQKIHAPKSEYNKFGGFAYRNAEAIYRVLKPILKEFECVLTLSDDIVLMGDRFYVKATATLSHKGESLSVSAYARESFDKKGMGSEQITGSCSSYARKYAMGGLFLLDDNKDIDSMENNTTQEKQELNNVSLAQQVTSELRNKLHLNNSQIRLYMEKINLKSSDLQGLKTWLDNKETNINNAKEWFKDNIEEFANA